MAGQISINFSDTIESVTILDDCPAPVGAVCRPDKSGNDLSVKSQEKGLTNACQALSDAAAKVNKLYENIIAQRSEEIAKLSTEIARRILMQKTESKDYEIESIIKEVLRNSPSRQDVVIHLNPEDFAQCQKIQDKDKNSMLAGIKLVADPNVGRAECILKSPKGTIVSMIDEQLEQIREALGKAT
jgi:flagellar biosynthesis/type III secretory pathway protein FliH